MDAPVRKDYCRWGHRRAWVTALAQGYGVCRETFRRIWRGEGLRVLLGKKRKRLTGKDHRKVALVNTLKTCGL